MTSKLTTQQVADPVRPVPFGTVEYANTAAGALARVEGIVAIGLGYATLTERRDR